MSGEVLAELAIGLLFGLFLVVLAIVQLATKTLITGRGRGGIARERNSPLLYIFAPLELLVGLAAWGLTGFLAYNALLLTGSCNEREAKHVCVEYRHYEDLSSVSKACRGGMTSEQRCDQDNLLGWCTVEADGRERKFYYYSNGYMGTPEQRTAECAALQGTWKKYGK